MMYREDKNAVRSAADRLIAAFGRHDRDAYFSCFAPSATFDFYTLPKRLESRDEYLQEWLRLEAEENFQVVTCRSLGQRIDCIGDCAIFSHEVETHVTTRDADTSILFERETIVFKRQGSGQWIAVHEHLSPQWVANAEAASGRS